MGQKFTRTRKSDLRDQLAHEAQKRHIEAEKAATEAPTSSEPRGAADPTPRMDQDDLAAIASMSMDDLAALMEGGAVTKPIAIGERVEGRITRMAHDTAFVDVGGKAEGQIALAEVADFNPGDTVEAFVIAADDDLLLLSRKLGGAGADAFLDQAAESGIPVEGKVVGRNPGGFDVRIGSVRAFCPVSHIDANASADLDSYIGQELMFQVLESGDDVVLSRRNLMKEERAAAAEEIWATISEGDTFTGTVSNVHSWGAFVDLGGVDGLVPARELSWETRADATQLVTRGQTLEVQVLAVDREAKKLTLSAKDPSNSPWSTRVGTEFVENGLYTATVVDVTDFGAFMSLAPGLQGLLHFSRMPGGRSALPPAGTSLEVRLVEIDESRRRLGLAHPEHKGGSAPVESEMVTGTVKDVLMNGVVLELEDGKTGWLPAREVDLPAGTVLSQRFRRGRTVTARVAGHGRDGARIELSMKSNTDEGRAAWNKVARDQKADDSGFGTMGALLAGWNKK